MDTVQIDLDKIIADRTAKSGKKVPKFIVNYLKRLVHQDEINEILLDGKDLTGAAFIDNALRMLRGTMVTSSRICTSAKSLPFL